VNYYNEWDSFAAEWLKQLIKDGLIPNGEVDSRSIADVEPSDLKGFTQCHFFAGIGGWSRALQIAGWSSDRPVWTGSPPCQSFSTAGTRKGKDDERHLWPVFFNLIRECQPPTVFGEQVAAAIRFGWLDDLQIDFEKEGYAAGAFVLPSGSIGAPHKRDRLFFVADSHNERHERSAGVGWEAQRGTEHSGSGSMADSEPEGFQGRLSRRSDQERQNLSGHIGRCGATDSVGNAEHDGSYGAEVGRSAFETSNCGKKGQDVSCESEGTGRSEIARDIRFWDDSTTIYCRDGKNRLIPTEPALFPLADGIRNRVGILRGAGNAIVPQAAAEIIKAYLYD
jgi:DNA (cytosine-5)-methyltransferase 1